MVLEQLPEVLSPWASMAKTTQDDPRKEAFVQEYGPYAKRYGAITGIAPEVLLAMGASESNWGAAGSIFGIKGTGPSGGSQTYDTWEAGPNGERIPQKAQFATYSSPDEAFQHFASLMQTERYKPASDYVKATGDSAGFLRMITDAGYATDRNWPNLITGIANGLSGGQFPDAPPPAQGSPQAPPSNDIARWATGVQQQAQAKADSGIGITVQQPNDIQAMAQAVVKKRIDAQTSRQALIDEEARANLERDLGTPMANLKHEDVGSTIGAGFKSYTDTSIKPPGVDTTIHPTSNIDALTGAPPGADYGPATQQQSDTSAAIGAVRKFDQNGGLLGLGNTGTLTGAATSDIPYAQTVKDAVGSALDTSVPGTGGLVTPGSILTGVPGAALNTAKYAAGKLGLPDVPGAGKLIAGQLPSTYLDAALTLSPGDLAKAGGAVFGGLRGAEEAAQGVRGAEGVLSIVPKNKKQLESAMEQSLRIAEDAKQAVLARGGTAQEARQAAAAAMRDAGAAETAAVQGERQIQQFGEAQQYTNTGKRLRQTAQELESRMGPGVVDNAASTVAKAPDALSREADVLDAANLGNAANRDQTLSDIARTAKIAGDPAAAIRRELQQGNGQPDTVNAATNKGDMFTDAAKAERQAAKTEEQAAKSAETRQIEEMQARVDARETERRRQEWVQGLRDTVEKMAPGQAVGPNASAREVLQQAERVKAARDFALKQKPGERILTEIGGTLGAPKALALAADTGAARDLTILGSHPDTIGDALESAIGGGKAFLSKEGAVAAEAGIKADPRFEALTSTENLKRPIHDYGYGPGVASEKRAPEMSGLNSSSISQTVQEIPWVAGSDRALAVQRNILGFKTAYGRYDFLAQKYGVDNPRFWSELQSTADWINHTRGFSGGDLAHHLSAVGVFTSPQQAISRLQIIADPLIFAMRGDKESAKFAAENLLGFVTSQAAMLGFLRLTAKTTGTSAFSVQADPLAGDFGTVRVGNERYDTLAGLGPTVRVLSKVGAEASDAAFGTDYSKNQQALEDVLVKWLENKANPVTRIFAEKLLHHKNPDTTAIAGLVAPTLATGIMESLANERGANKLLAAPSAALSFGGVGTNAYKTPDDEANQIASDKYGGRKFNDLTPLERIPVMSQLPQEAQKGVRQTERQTYNDALKAAGYQQAPKDADGKPIKESPDVSAARSKANAEVFKNNPELDVQHWFWTDSTDPEQANGGALKTKEAVDKALALNLPDTREIRYQGADRNLATEQGRKLWEASGARIEKFYSPDFINKNPQVADYYALRRFDKPYKDLKPEDQAKIATTMRTQAIIDTPSLDALHAYLGIGGSDKHYEVHSQAAAPELEKLRQTYGRAPAKEGYKFFIAEGAK